VLRKNKNFKIDVLFDYNVYLCGMVKDKGEKYKNQIVIHPDDFEKEGEFLNEKGETVHALDIWEYCRYFADYIQLRTDDMADGIDIMSFADKHGFLYLDDYSKKEQQKAFMETLFSFTADGRICKFQHDMASIYKKRINAMALCALCLFINDIIHQKLVVLLKPTLEDVTNSISNLSSVTFTNQDGSSISSDNELLLASIKKVIPHEEETTYVADRIVDRQDVFTKELMQIEFFYYLSHFFNQYFKIKRRGLLTDLESEIIGYFLKWFGLSPVEVSYSRLRQLRMNFKLVENYHIYELSTDNKRIKVQWQFLKYSDWSKGKINPLKCNIESIGDSGTVIFPPNISGFDLLKR
jgi:hypothetical protein